MGLLQQAREMLHALESEVREGGGRGMYVLTVENGGCGLTFILLVGRSEKGIFRQSLKKIPSIFYFPSKSPPCIHSGRLFGHAVLQSGTGPLPEDFI